MVIAQPALDAVLTHVLSKFRTHRTVSSSSPGSSPRPFVLGLSGMQGSGKSTWANSLASSLRAPPHSLKVAVVSLDDFYHTHDKLVAVRESNSDNALFRNRGQPGTHDEVLAEEFFGSLRDTREGVLKVPSFDKSRFGGEGDRAPEEGWETVEVSPESPVDILIFEGWCVGFRALGDEGLVRRWEAAREKLKADTTTTEKTSESEAAGEEEEEPSQLSDRQLSLLTQQLATHPLGHVRTVNRNLARYNETFMGPRNFDYLVHLDTDRLANVYRWRMQQEHALKKARGTGMTDGQVVDFVKVYMPAYELYLDGLRGQAFAGEHRGTQLRVVLDEGRGVGEVSEF